MRPWAFGSFLPVQTEKLVRAARTAGVRTYCEVGFNGGHTAAAVLAATRHVTVRTFDSGEYGTHTKRNAKFLRSVHPRRFAFTFGDSVTTLQLLAARVRSGAEPPCDLMLLDGSHKEDVALADLSHFRAAASPNALLILDDLDSPAARTVLLAVQQGWLRLHAWYLYHVRPKNEMPLRELMWECPRCLDGLPNLTIVSDRARRLLPCMRWIHKGCTPTSWPDEACQLCHNGAAWGLAGFS